MVDFYTKLCIACKNENVPVSKAVVEAGEKLGSLSGWKKGAVPNSKAVLALALRLNVTTDFLLDRPPLTSAEELSFEEKMLLKSFRACSAADRVSLLDLADLYRKRADEEVSSREEFA